LIFLCFIYIYEYIIFGWFNDSALTFKDGDVFCHQNQNAKNIGYFTTLLKPHNIGTHLKGI
jgi:hypothetical protein